MQTAAPVGDDRNAIPDGGFEKEPTAWKNQTQCARLRYSLDASQFHTGGRSARIDCLELVPPEAQSTLRFSAWGRWYQTGIPVKAGKTYRLRVWVRTSDTFAGSVNVWVSGGGEKGTLEARALNTEGMWKEVVFDRVVPASDVVSIYLNLMNGTGTVWFDDVELVEATQH
jgi:hypothetical protein